MSVGLEVSKSKSGCMLLKGILSTTRPPWIKIRNGALPYVKNIMYLGIAVSERLSFILHFKDIKERQVKTTAPSESVLRKRWGLCLSLIRTWWTGLFSAIAIYGAAVWMG